MSTKPMYVPVLKGKEGEFAALETLAGDIKRQLMPLIEIPGVPYDYANERPSKSLDEHVAGYADRLRRCWQSGPLYIHLPWFGEEERMEDGRVALEAVLAECVNLNVKAVPVVWRASSADYVAAAGRYSAASGTGVCIRLLVEDFKEDIDLDEEVDRLWNGLGGGDKNSLDVIID